MGDRTKIVDMSDPKPPRQICQICGFDDDVEIIKRDEDWVMTCSGPSHPPYEWQPKKQSSSAGSWRTGIGEELGVYDTLLECMTPDICEYGIIEHRFSEAAPGVYTYLVDHYGHRATKPSKYTASSFLGGALGQLWREELVAGVWGPATGYWKYNGGVGCYALPEADEDSPILSWETFATDTLHVSPLDWPALGFVGSSPGSAT